MDLNKKNLMHEHPKLFVDSNNEAKSKQSKTFKSFCILDPPYSFFIGLRRIENTSGLSQFAWVDGTPLSSTWSNWFTGEPNNFAVNRADKENCVIMGWTFDLDSTFRWRDVSCSFISRVICERTVGKKTIIDTFAMILSAFMSCRKFYSMRIFAEVYDKADFQCM